MRACDGEIEVAVAWGDGAKACVLAVVYLASGERFVAGESKDCDVLLPAEALGVTRLVWTASAIANALEEAPGGEARLILGAFAIRARRTESSRDERAAVRPFGLPEVVPSVAVSALAHALVLALLATQAPDAQVTREATQTRAHLLAASIAGDEAAERTRAALGVEARAPRDSLVMHHAAEMQPPGAPTESPRVAVEPASATTAPEGKAQPFEGPRIGTDSPDMLERIREQIASWDPRLVTGKYDPRFSDPRLRVQHPEEMPDRRIPKVVIDGVVRANFNRFHMCHHVGLPRSVALAGEVDVTFVIGPGGDVIDARDAGGAFDDGAVRRCVVQTFRRLSFPPTPRGQEQTVTYPVMLEGAGRGNATGG